jgi:hypothetical protein
MEQEARTNSFGFGRIYFWTIFLSMAIFASWFVVTNYLIRSHGRDPANACRNNLRQIDGAKEQWALENKKPDGTVLTADDEEAVDAFIKGGRLSCPVEGKYSYNAIGVKPSCSYKKRGKIHLID